MNVPTADVSLCLITTDHVTVDPVPAHDHVTVHLAGNVTVFSSDPQVMENLARAFWDAADQLHAKQDSGGQLDDSDGIARNVASTLALIATGGAA